MAASETLEPTPQSVGSARALKLPGTLIIAIANLKGGVGKTTTAFFLACYFAVVHGKRVLVVDADPLSQTGYAWFRKIIKAGGTWPFHLEVFPSRHVDDFLKDKTDSGRWDVIIVDTGGESDSIMKAAVRRAQELLIIAATSEAEQDRIPPTLKSAEEAAADAPQEIAVRVLLTKVPTAKGSVEERRARENLRGAQYDTLHACAHNWQWYRDAYPNSNPMDDLAEYRNIGDELIADYYEVA